MRRTDTLMKLTADPETMPDSEGLVLAMKPELNKIFKPAFLGRMMIVPYFPVRDEALRQIIRLKIGKIQRRIFENHKIAMSCDDAVISTKWPSDARKWRAARETSTTS